MFSRLQIRNKVLKPVLTVSALFQTLKVFRYRNISAFTFSATVDSKGRITVPAKIRNKLGLGKGDQVALSLESCEVITKEVDSYREAVEFVRHFDSVKSFSFSEGVVEVVLGE